MRVLLVMVTSKYSFAAILHCLLPHLFGSNAQQNPILLALFAFKLRQNPTQSCVPLVFRGAPMTKRRFFVFSIKEVCLHIASILICVAAIFCFTACKNKKDAVANKTNISIAVFIPGTLSGSATYQMLADGVKKAAAEYPNAEVLVVEANYNQAEWESKLTALAASNKYDLIVSSNPSMPEIAAAVQKKFPAQRFMILDGKAEGNPAIYTFSYNQHEQAYMGGYLAALLCQEAEIKNPRIGLLSAQEYPVMTQTILPAYEEGAKAVLPQIEVDFRIIGNWFDASKATSIASLMIADGAKVILTIAGDANDGAVKAAETAGARIIWFDTNGYAIKPGIIAGSCVYYQDKAAYNKTKLFLENQLPFGKHELGDVSNFYVDFIEDDPLYIQTVSPVVREKQSEMIKKIRSGELLLPN
ncbi:MAG: BMP family ABC transporter substrate-binding protein [Termitinemataceae bacterium]|nr:MAG: BMP family ABC transporter substrate-binding protein [Termitinemataceae bacterium]